MQSTKKELLEGLERIKGTPVMVVGDLILDRYIWGDVSRISPEAPVPVVEVKKTEDRLGGAGNAARNLISLEAKVSVCGFIGDDDEGKVLLSLLDQSNIRKDGVMIDRAKPTIIKTRIIGQRQQIVRLDREETSERPKPLSEGFASMVDAHLDENKAIIISDYGKGAVSVPLIAKLDQARAKKRIDLKTRPLVVDPHPTNYGIYSTMSVAKPNRKEAEIASGIKIKDRASAVEASRVLLTLWKADMMLVTLGEMGMVIAFADGTPPITLDTRARQVFDVSGAGDAVTAVFTVAIASGSSARVAGDLANIAAGIVVSEVGTVAVNPVRLRAEIEELD